MSSRLKVVFVGCVEEGRECLQEIVDYGAEVQAIFTFTDAMAAKMSGAVSFDKLSAKYEIPLHKVKSTNSPEAVELFKQYDPDVIFVIGWTRLVAAEVLSIPPLGCIGMHASLLPKYRGRAPVNWNIIYNEPLTGNTSIQLDEGVDTGGMLAQREITISSADTCQTLYHKVAASGRSMIREMLPQLEQGEVPVMVQRDEEASEMPKRGPEDGVIDWTKSAYELFHWVRALTYPYPGAFTSYSGQRLFIWEARLAHFPPIDLKAFESLDRTPGTIFSVDDGIAVISGDGALLTVHQLSFAGEPGQNWRDFLEKTPLRVGERLGE